MSLRAWRKGYDEKTYFETQKEFSQEWSDASGLLIDPTPRYSASYISQKYGRYNEVLKNKEWAWHSRRTKNFKRAWYNA